MIGAAGRVQARHIHSRSSRAALGAVVAAARRPHMAGRNYFSALLGLPGDGSGSPTAAVAAAKSSSRCALLTSAKQQNSMCRCARQLLCAHRSGSGLHKHDGLQRLIRHQKLAVSSCLQLAHNSTRWVGSQHDQACLPAENALCECCLQEQSTQQQTGSGNQQQPGICSQHGCRQ